MKIDLKAGVISLAVFFTCAFTAGCGGGSGSGLPVEDMRDITYTMSEFDVFSGYEDESINGMWRYGDNIGIACYYWDENDEQVYKVICTDLNGTRTGEIKYASEPGSYFENMVMGPDGSMYVSCEVNSYDEDGAYTEQGGRFIEKYDPNGKLVWKEKYTSEDSNSYINCMIYSDKYGVITSTENGISVYDADNGKGRFVFKPSNLQEYSDYRLYAAQDGTIYASIPEADYQKYDMYKVDLEKRDVTDVQQMPAGFYGYNLFAGTTHDFLYCDSDRIHYWKPGMGEFETLCSFTASDILTTSVRYVIEIDDKNFIAVFYDDSVNRNAVARFTKVEPSDYHEKDTLTLSCVFIDDDIRRAVVEYNRGNNDYRIQIRDYAKLDENAGKDYYEILESMNLDISAGKVPDIIVLSNSQPASNYVNKGLFTDLYKFIDDDPDMERDTFCSNVLEAYSIDGKLYQLPSRFTVATCAVSPKITGGETVTLSNYKEICEKNGIELADIFGDMKRSWGLTQIMQSSGQDFIDWKAGKCSFNSEEFINLLELLKAMPENYEDDYDYQKYETYYREGKALFYQMWISDFDDLKYARYGAFGSEIKINGYPGIGGGVSMIQPNYLISIAQRSKYRDTAWSFIKTLISQKVQDPPPKDEYMYQYGFPIRMDSLDKCMEQALIPDSYIDEETGEKVEIKNSYWIAGQEIEVPNLTKEDAEELKSVILSVTTPMTTNDKVMSIIEEETGAYFSGQKSAKDVSDIIQSRVSIYLSESR